MPDGLESGHMGRTRTLHKIKEKYYWPGMVTSVNEYVASCSQCGSYKKPQYITRSELYPIHVSDVWEKLHIDLIGPLPVTAQNNRHICLMVDAFSKFIAARAIPTKSAEHCADALYDEVYMKLGARQVYRH